MQTKKVKNTHIDSLIPVQPVSKLFLYVFDQVKFHVVMDYVSMVLVFYQLPGYWLMIGCWLVINEANKRERKMRKKPEKRLLFSLKNYTQSDNTGKELKVILSVVCEDVHKSCWLTFRSGGRDLMNSRITACASFFTLGGISPFTITLRKLYFLQIWKM